MDTDTTEATTTEMWVTGDALIVVPVRLMKKNDTEPKALGRVKPRAVGGVFRTHLASGMTL